VVNPSFVDASNTVASSKIADARIEYKSAGQISEGQIMGWLARFFLNVMPF
jgi:flagellar L-ring protein precursor FlgH